MNPVPDVSVGDEDSSSLRQNVQRLEDEVDRLKRQLGELHCTDANALRRAYKALCQHVDALDQESSGMLEELEKFETDVMTPDVVATELMTASALSVGLSVVHQSLKVTPLAGARWLFKGMWALGGAYILWRLTAGTLARVAGMLSRNSKRKRQLAAKLETVEERIHIMASLLNWAEARGEPSPALSQHAIQQPFQQPHPPPAWHDLQHPGELAGQEGMTEGGGGGGGSTSITSSGGAGTANSARSSSPELVVPPPRVLVSSGQGTPGGSDLVTPAHSRSPSHSPPKARGEGSEGRLGGSSVGGSPSRPDFSVEMEPLMRYAQLGSKLSTP